MGTTFTNLQVRTGNQEFPDYVLPPGYEYVRTAEEWTAVYETSGHHNFKKMQKLGRDMSKAVDVPVMAVSYFDDDIFEMRLMKDGKTEASYQTGPGMLLVKKGPAFIKALGLAGKEASAFRYLLKRETSAQDSIDSFSRLLGAMLYGDMRMHKDTEEVWKKDAAPVIRGMDAEKKQDKVVNHTVLTLCQEIPGLLVQHREQKERIADTYDRVVRIVHPGAEGDYDFSHVSCYQERDGRLEAIYDYHYPEAIFTAHDKDLGLDYEHREIQVMDLDAYYDGSADWDRYEPLIAERIRIPEDRKSCAGHAPRFCSWYGQAALGNGTCEYYYGYGKLEKIDWQSSGMTFSERNIVSEYVYENLDHVIWNDNFAPPVLEDGKIILVRLWKQYVGEPAGAGQSVRKPGVWDTALDVRFFDGDLNLLRRKRIQVDPEAFQTLGMYAYGAEQDCLYFASRCVELKTHQCRPYPAGVKGNVLSVRDSRGNIYIADGHSLYVMGQDRSLLSQHRFKGAGIYYYVNRKGNLCFITSDDETCQWNKARKGACVRLYEVEEMR